MSPEPVTTTALVKGAVDFLASVWTRAGLLFWCLATTCIGVLVALIVGAHFHTGDFGALLSQYGSWLFLGGLVFAIFAGFKTYEDRKPSLLSLIAKDDECLWNRIKQPNGTFYSQIHIQFQATNLGDHTIMLSGHSLSRPCVRRQAIVAATFLTRHPTKNEYGSRNPIPAHSLTYCALSITVNRAIGRLGKPIRVVVKVRDHTGVWHKLVCPYVKDRTQ